MTQGMDADDQSGLEGGKAHCIIALMAACSEYENGCLSWTYC